MNCAFPNPNIKVLTFTAFFGIRVIVDIIYLDEVIPSEVVPESNMTGAFIKRRNLDTNTHTRRTPL